MRILNSDPINIVNTFMNALHTGDFETAKSTLSKGSLKEIQTISDNKNSSFEVVLRAFLFSFYVSLPNKIDKEVIRGNKAFVEVSNKKHSSCFALCKEEGVWKMALDCKVMAIVVDENFVKKAFNYLKEIFRNTFSKNKNEVLGTKAK